MILQNIENLINHELFPVSFFLSFFYTPGWVERETYYWSTELLCSSPLHLHLFLSRHSILGKTHLQMPPPP